MDLQTELQNKYDQIEAAIKELEKINSEQYKTNGTFRYNPTNSYSSLDVHSTMAVGELIHAYAFIQNKSAQYHAAAAEIGLSEYPVFKWCGYMPEDWFFDIQLRVKLMKHHGELEKFKQAKAKIQPYLLKDNIIQQLLLELPV